MTESSRWKLVDCQGVAAEPNDTTIFTLESEGKTYVVTLTAPNHASTTEYHSALRAAVAFYEQAAQALETAQPQPLENEVRLH